MKIKDIDIGHGICLAPMAGYTDRAMRLVCHELGADFSVTEMVSAKAVVYNDKKTFALARIRADEGPVGLQIFGSDPEIMAEAAARLIERAEGALPTTIDINMGCPVHKIFSNGEGSALMRSPELIEKITRAVSGAINIPCTVKIRSGVDSEHINAVECAMAAEAGGAALICVHGRTRVQMYGGYADREIIRNVKNSLKIPVIANGDITNTEEALSMLSDTGADGIAIGRGAVGNPYIFSEIKAAIENKTYTPPSFEERVRLALRQLKIAVDDKGEAIAIPESRKQIALYLRSFSGAAALRAEINQATTYLEVEKIMESSLKKSTEA